MVQSFQRYWPRDTRLTVYAEGFVPEIKGIHVRELPAWLNEFKGHYGRVPTYCGKLNNGQYDYRFDGVKFAHKVAALTDFALGFTEGVVIWLDADTLTHAPVTKDWLEGLFPEPAYLAWLDRSQTHPECGFMMFRANYPHHIKFMESFRDIYLSGEIFKLREFHDSYVFQQLVLRKISAGKIPPPASLSGDRNWHHPFVNGPLGSRMDHLKGPRKIEGKSRRWDTRRPRQEAYWK